MNKKRIFMPDICSALKEIPVPVYVTDVNRTIVYWNRYAEEVSGYKKREVVGMQCSSGIMEHTDEKGRIMCFGSCPLSDSIEKGCRNSKKVYMKHKDGYRIPVEVYTSPVKSDDGEVIGAVEMFLDDSKYKNAKKKIETLESMAFFDEMTGIQNRNSFNNRIRKIRLSQKRSPKQIGFLFFDIDRFKNVNDNYGHDFGDSVLRAVAKTIDVTLRPEDEIYRYGGEEFVAICLDVTQSQLMRISERVRSSVAGLDFFSKDEKIKITISSGGFVCIDNDVYEAIKKADQALYMSKKSGRNKTTIL